MQNIRFIINKITHFITTDIWRIRVNDLPIGKSFLINQLRIIILASRGFFEDKCMLRASSLTFYSLLSIVPVAAMAFGIAKGFGFDKLLEKQLYEKLPVQEEVLNQVVTFSNSMLENTKGGIIAGLGLVLLFWSVIKVLGHIEGSFNDIWEIKESRAFGRKFSDYLSTMMIGPVLMFMSSSVTVFITTQVTNITEKVALIGFFSPVILLVLKLLPYCLIWVLFTIVYILMPNTKVNFRSGAIAGVIAGTIYVIAQWAYIYFQIGIGRNNAIYGGFAAFPLFLVWLQISWLIVLFGAEISFASQNVDTYEFEPDCLQTSLSFKKLISLQIAHLLVKNFSKGEKPLTAEQVSHILEVPIRLVREILYELVESGVISDTRTKKYKELAYQPARDISILTVTFVLEALEHRGTDTIPVAQTQELERLSETLQAFADTTRKLPSNKLLKDI
ncbi:MAG: YihY family inner membrane protein [Deltaproteobacteria bacterium]|nr:YihY family inner membrane protein [Deltaproteobacteria bacterium]MBW1985043.1 YihY family inner membrane protein [Deltaproteobacteria bacterium]MBW2363766.1 YihY family inner membrane protein [Deltaproteobacteria bacterium]